jgi:GAF domain-containing protein
MYDPAIIDVFRDVWASTAPAGSQSLEQRSQAPVPTAGPAMTPDDPAVVTDHELRLALDLGAALARISEDDSAWRVLAEALRQLPGVDTAAIFVVDQEQHRLAPAHTSGRHARIVSELSMAVGERLSGWVAATGRPMINADAALDLFEIQGCSLRSAMAVPCTGTDGGRMVLTLYSAGDAAFSSMHQRLLGAAASFVHAATRQPRVWREISARTLAWPESTRH